ncbi:MAG: cytochrome-c peroxidase, partial [Ottowia sp.]|nr:cytochrome-c peroxidase [Ottowia sp.]
MTHTESSTVRRRPAVVTLNLIGQLALGIGLAAAAVGAHAQLDEPIKPLPLDVKADARKVALGAKLFSDRRLSGDNSVACVSCHNLGEGGADRLAL